MLGGLFYTIPWITLFAAIGGFIWLASIWPSESVKGLPREDIFDRPDPYQVSLLQSGGPVTADTNTFFHDSRSTR